MIKRILAFAILTLALACSGGYSFTGGDVGNAKTISIKLFPNYAELVNPTLSQNFTEDLRETFIQQTNLNLTPDDGDLMFEGSIIGYSVSPQASSANQVAAQTRLSVTVNVIFTNNLEPIKSFEQKFTSYRDYPATQDLSQVETELVSQITKELAEKIMNRAIVNW